MEMIDFQLSDHEFATKFCGTAIFRIEASRPSLPAEVLKTLKLDPVWQQQNQLITEVEAEIRRGGPDNLGCHAEAVVLGGMSALESVALEESKSSAEAQKFDSLIFQIEKKKPEIISVERLRQMEREK